MEMRSAESVMDRGSDPSGGIQAEGGGTVAKEAPGTQEGGKIVKRADGNLCALHIVGEGNNPVQ